MSAIGALALLVVTAAFGVAFYLADRRKARVEERRTRVSSLAERMRRSRVEAVVAWHGMCASSRVRPSLARSGRWSARDAAVRQLAATAGDQIWGGRSWSLGFGIVAFGLAIAWTYVFVLQRELDVQLMLVLGHDPDTAQVLGTAVAVGIAVCGLLISGLVGLHSLLPSRVQQVAWVRRTAAVFVACLFLVLALALPAVAVYRSQNVLGAEVTRLEKVLAQERSASSPDSLRVEVAAADLVDAQRRLEVGESLDRTVTVIVPLIELLTSFAPVYALELVLLGLLSGVAGFARWRSTVAWRRAERRMQHEHTDIVEALYQAEVDLADLQPVIDRTHALPPVRSDVSGGGPSGSSGNVFRDPRGLP